MSVLSKLLLLFIGLISLMNIDDRTSLILEQENNLKSSGVFSVDGVIDFLESLV